MKKILAILALVLTAGVAAARPPEDVAKALIKLENDWAKAGLAGDAAALEKLLTPDYVYTNPDAAMATRAEAILDRLVNPRRRGDPRIVIPSREERSAAVLTLNKHRAEEDVKKQLVKLAALELERAQTVLEMYTIRSPVNGVIRAIRKHRGETVRNLETIFEIEFTERD